MVSSRVAFVTSNRAPDDVVSYRAQSNTSIRSYAQRWRVKFFQTYTDSESTKYTTAKKGYHLELGPTLLTYSSTIVARCHVLLLQASLGLPNSHWCYVERSIGIGKITRYGRWPYVVKKYFLQLARRSTLNRTKHGNLKQRAARLRTLKA